MKTPPWKQTNYPSDSFAAKKLTGEKNQRYMKTSLVQASDYLAARKLVASINKGQSLPFFDETFFRPLYDNDIEFKKHFDALLAADHNGMYVSVFLNELRKLAELLFPEPSNEKAQDDINLFLQFLYNLCIKAQNHTMRYTGVYIKVDVAFTGTDKVLSSKGYDFYTQKCYDALNSTSKTVYLFALGVKRQDAVGIEKRFHELHPGLATSTQTPYTHIFDNHSKKEGICIEFDKVKIRG
jgi:hypothetical protein